MITLNWFLYYIFIIDKDKEVYEYIEKAFNLLRQLNGNLNNHKTR